jgi:hypothetical protein
MSEKEIIIPPIFREEIVIDSTIFFPEEVITSEYLRSYKEVGMTYSQCLWHKLGQLKEEELQKEFINIQLEQANDPMTWVQNLKALYIYYYNRKITAESNLYWNDGCSSLKGVIKDFEKKYKKIELKSFGFKKNQFEKIELIFCELQSAIELVDEERCTINDLMDVLFSSNLNEIQNPIYFSRQNTQLKYILDSLKNLFPELTVAKVADSRLFYGKEKGGTTPKILNRQDLYAAKTKDVKNKDLIDDVLKKYQ